jgi:hypothetical protein
LGLSEETVELVTYTKCEGNIEGWLLALEHKMQETLKDIIRAASGICSSSSMNLKEFIKSQKC